MTAGGRLFRIAVVMAALLLFVESVRVLGVNQILAGLARVGWGFAGIVAISGAREAVRGFAWTKAVDDGRRLGFLPAFRARLAGEALNALVPMGIVVGEPVKASHVRDHLPFPAAARALALEFAFYTASLVLLFGAGLTAFAFLHGLTAVALTIASLAIATCVLALRFTRRIPWSSATPPTNLAQIAASEVAYQVLSVAEVYVTLRLLSPLRASVVSAITLETVSRAVTMAFKMVPLRVGVDEASSSLVAARLHLDPAVGLALAIVRKLRVLVWSALGLVFLVRGSAGSVAPAGEPTTVMLRLGLDTQPTLETPSWTGAIW